MTEQMHDTIPSQRFPVEPYNVACIASILRDPNPIHFDPAAVRMAGLGDRPINQGPASLGYAVTMLLNAFPGYRLQAIDSRYLANVLVGDTAEVFAEIQSTQDDLIVCKYRVANGAGADAVVGTATLVRT